YVVVGPREASPRPRLVLDYDGPDARVWRNDAALPRAFVVFNARCVDDQTGLELIRQGRLSFRDEVLLGDCVDPPIPGRSGTGSATIERYDTTAVTITTTTDVPGLLVLTDTWFPGWRARLDDREAPIMRADHTFRAVALPPGQHRVEFTYWPTSLRIGLMISAVAAAPVPWLGLWGARCGRAKGASHRRGGGCAEPGADADARGAAGTAVRLRDLAGAGVGRRKRDHRGRSRGQIVGGRGPLRRLRHVGVLGGSRLSDPARRVGACPRCPRARHDGAKRADASSDVEWSAPRDGHSARGAGRPGRRRSARSCSVDLPSRRALAERDSTIAIVVAHVRRAAPGLRRSRRNGRHRLRRRGMEDA